ncbi:type II toxin-antitoxin system RelE/ParE family toxin [Escherichia coli]
MRLEWKPMSLSDREQIMEYISKDNPLAAIALDNQFEAIAEQACERPEMYRAGRVAGTHEAVVRPHYVLVYQVEGDTLSVLRVLHTALQWYRQRNKLMYNVFCCTMMFLLPRENFTSGKRYCEPLSRNRKTITPENRKMPQYWLFIQYFRFSHGINRRA